MKAEVVIVGGGVMGTSLAMALADRLDPVARPTLLFERAGQLAAGSSGRSGAILRQHYADLEVARMARDSLSVYAGFSTRFGRDLGFRRTGVLSLAGPRAPEWVERVRACTERLRAGGIEIELVDAARIRELVPGIAVDDAAVGAWEPGGGFVDPVATVESFAAVARSRGAVTRLGVEVTALRVRSGRVVGVETSEGAVEAERVALVAGPWSARLLADAGVDLPLRVVRPEQHFLRMPGAVDDADAADPDLDPAELDPLARLERESVARKAVEPEPHPSVIDLELGYYARCEPAAARTRVGRIEYVADEALDDPDELDEEVSEDMRRFARAALGERLPIYADQPDDSSEAALYTLTPDAQALIGPAPGVEGLVVVTGFSGHGFKLAPAVGEGVAQMLLGESVTAFDAEFFSPARFEGSAAEWGGKFGL